MPKGKKKQISINLLPKDPFFVSPVGRSMRWALGAGKYIVIFTELIVIIAFLTRVALDQMVNNYDKAIDEKKTLIMDYAESERKIRVVQKKIDVLKTIDMQTDVAAVFPKLTATIPEEITLEQLTISTSDVTLVGYALSSEALTKLLNNYLLHPDFFNVDVNEIQAEVDDDEEDIGIYFSLTADIEREAGFIDKETDT